MKSRGSASFFSPRPWPPEKLLADFQTSKKKTPGGNLWRVHPVMQWGVVNFFSPDVLQFAHEIHPEATVLPAYSMTEVAPGVESRVGGLVSGVPVA